MKKKLFEVVLDPPIPGEGVDYVRIEIDANTDVESLKWIASLIKDRVVAVYDLDDKTLKELFGDIFE